MLMKNPHSNLGGHGEDPGLTRYDKKIRFEAASMNQFNIRAMKRAPGSAKGKATYIALDFDNMLEDFLDYA